VRRLFGAALAHAVDKSCRSHAEAARKIGISQSTLRTWLRGTHRINLEKVAAASNLWSHFLRCLVVMERRGRVI
jgi:transposase-like protein